jgi:hypothetical protein
VFSYFIVHSSLLFCISITSMIPPITQITLPACRAHYPGEPEPVHTSVASRSVRPSPSFGQVGVHDCTFEACSGFTRVTAYRIARPPEVAFVTRLRPGPVHHWTKPLVSYQTYLQLSGWDFHPLVILRRWGAPKHPRILLKINCGGPPTP